MRKLVIAIVALLAFSPLPAPAADLQKGYAAIQAGDWDTALKEFQPLAEQGDAEAQTNLGQMYREGLGVTQDYSEAVKWYSLAAEQGNAIARYNLGLMYGSGQGVPQDDSEAVKWYRMAAEQGYAIAQNNLGVMHGSGRGVPQDYKLAYMWFNLSGANGYKKSTEVIKKLNELMTQDDIAKAQEMSAACLASDYKNCGD